MSNDYVVVKSLESINSATVDNTYLYDVLMLTYKYTKLLSHVFPINCDEGIIPLYGYRLGVEDQVLEIDTYLAQYTKYNTVSKTKVLNRFTESCINYNCVTLYQMIAAQLAHDIENNQDGNSSCLSGETISELRRFININDTYWNTLQKSDMLDSMAVLTAHSATIHRHGLESAAIIIELLDRLDNILKLIPVYTPVQDVVVPVLKIVLNIAMAFYRVTLNKQITPLNYIVKIKISNTTLAAIPFAPNFISQINKFTHDNEFNIPYISSHGIEYMHCLETVLKKLGGVTSNIPLTLSTPTVV